MADVDATFLDSVRFLFLALETALAAVGPFMTGVNCFFPCFFRVFFLAKLFWGADVTAFA